MADTSIDTQPALSLATETTTSMSETHINMTTTTTTTASGPEGKSFLMGLPLEMRHKIFGFAAQRPHGPYLILKEYLEKKDPDIGPSVQPSADNEEEDSEDGGDEEEDVENEGEEEDGEGEEEDGEGEEEGMEHEGEDENSDGEGDGEGEHHGQGDQTDEVYANDTTQVSGGAVESTASIIAPQPVILATPAANPQQDEAETMEIDSDEPINEEENDEAGSEEAEVDEEQEEEEDNGNATTIPPPPPPPPPGTFIPFPNLPFPNAATAGAPINATAAVQAPRPRPAIRYFGRDNKYRHVLPIIQLSHAPPPLGLLQTSKQLHEEALNYHLSTCVIEIDVTRSFMHQSIFEETLDKFITNGFSPLEQIRKISLTFSWDTEWLTNKTSGADPELFGDWAFTYGLQDRTEKVKQLVRACPDLRKLTIDWHDSERSPKSEALMNEIVMGFLELTSKQWSDNITRESGFLDVTATEHFTEKDTVHHPDSIIGRRRQEFDSILALINAGREPFR
jgi:hypothetical protein